MLAGERQRSIVELVGRDGAVKVGELVERFGVSDMTIRRDLELLAERGLLVKVHGGATAVAPSSAAEPGFGAKSAVQQAEKEAIAERAAQLLAPGGSIALSGGTTTHALARRLVDVERLAVVTNSIPVADVFHANGRADQTVVLTGGLRTPSDALVGPLAVAAIRSLNVDLLFLGVHGMSVRAGFTTPNLLEAETDRALFTAAARRVVLADHTKWETIGISTIAALADPEALITDRSLPQDALSILTDHVRSLILA
ncbi:DeoR/GlpR family DNA-binding transcription regulator [Actinocorallia lasiicapitis]